MPRSSESAAWESHKEQILWLHREAEIFNKYGNDDLDHMVETTLRTRESHCVIANLIIQGAYGHKNV